MKPFAKMQSALPEPSGFAAARLLDFSEFQSGAFAAEFFGVGGVFQRFFRAAAIRFARAARSLSLIFFGTPLPILPSACAALFIVLLDPLASAGFVGSDERRMPCEFSERQTIVTCVERLGAANATEAHPIFPCSVLFVGRSVGGGFPILRECSLRRGCCVVVVVFLCHAGTVKRFTESVTNYFQKSFVADFSLGGGGGSETSCPKPREKSNNH